MGKDTLHKIDTRTLGQLLAAQNVLFALPAEKQIAEYYAKLLSSIPGINSCKVCFGNSGAQEGKLDDKPCLKCPNLIIDNKENLNTWNLSPCKLSKSENQHVIALETLEYRFGFFILKIEHVEIFEIYKPFISNLGSFVALTLENRLQKADLQKANNLLENKVKSRTKELQTVNDRLKKEIKRHDKTVLALQNSEEQFRFLYETMVQGVVIQDINGQIIDANEAACKILGLSKDEMTGKTTQDPRWKLIHEDGSPLSPNEMPSNIAFRTGKAVKNKLMGIYVPENESHHWILTSSIPKFSPGKKIPDLTLTTFSEITERKQAEQERIIHLNFLKNLDQINQIILKSEDLKQMMSDVLDKVQEIFGSDRSFLMYPCDPESSFWSIPIERNKPEFPGVLQMGTNMPMDSEVAKSLHVLLNTDGPVQFGPGTQYPLPAEISQKFGFKSFMSVALFPKTGKPWQFGIHQCELAHVWTTDEERLFQAIGYRLSDALGNLLTLRELQQSEQRFKLVFENSPVSIWEEDFSNIKAFFNKLRNKGITDIDNYFNKYPEAVSQCAEMVRIVDVNKTALALHGANTKQDLIKGLKNVFTPESFDTFKTELIYLWNGQTGMVSDTVIKTLEGKSQNVTIYFSVSPGYEESLSKILVSIIDITQRVQSQTELKRSENRYRSLYNKTPVMLHSIDREGKLISVSDYWLSTLGYTREEVIGRKSTEFLTKESQGYATAVVLPDFMKTGECYNIDYQFVKKDGQVIDCLLSAISERDSDGSVIRSLAVITNITKRKLAEKAILINEERYRMAQSIGHVGNWEYNLQTGNFWGSDEAKRIYGFDPAVDSFTTDEVENCIPERERVHQALLNLIENGKPYNLEFEIYPLNSTEPKIIASIADLICDKQGNPLRVVGVIHDITERKSAENTLNDTTIRLKEAQRLAHIGSWELDLKNNVLNWSEEIYRIFEIDPEKFDATYEAFINAIHPEDRLMVDTAYTNSIKTQIPYSIDHRLLFDDGRIKYVHEQCETFYKENVPVRSIGTVQDITERKLTEIKLKESEQLFRALVENSPDFIARYDRDYHRIYVNPSIKRLFGNSEKVLGETPEHKTPVYAPEIYIKNMQQVYETGSEKIDEIPFQTEKGEMHWGQMRFVPEFDQKGNVKSILAVGRDIHEIKENEKRFRMLAENFPDFVFRVSRDYRYIYVNPVIENAVGIPHKEFIGKTIIELPIYGKLEQIDEITNFVRNTFIEGKTNDFEILLDTKTGKRIFEFRFVPEKDATENVVSVVIIARDITERKLAEKELAKYREKLEELVKERTVELEEARNKAQQYLDIAGVMLVAINADQEITLINQRGCEVLEVDYHEIIGKNWFNTFVPKKDRKSVKQGFKMLMSGQREQVEYYENPVVTQNGEERLIAWHNILLHDENGNINGTLSSGEDITERKKAEEQIKQLNNDLQNRATELQIVNKELEAFAYSVSHDLRAPLRHIDGFMELLEAYTKDSLDQKSHDYMNKISDSAKRMGELIDELLSFSRMARQKLLTNTIDLNVLVNEIIQDLIPEFKEREIKWNIADLPKIKGDKSLLRIVIVNLILNAIKFTRPRKQAIINIGYQKQKKTYIFFVNDNGVGFDPAYKDKLFGVFQRLHRADEFEGTGIGLANVHRIISRHGGKVWAEGAINKGATFFFSLPLD
ncbi:MAG: PAS domain S-box protein [Bacteroidales bacterium]|nr:PAS domain S-box protein [Bacteroidales bacterium]